MEHTDEALLAVAQLLLDKLTERVRDATAAELNPQAMKHITGVMKDLKDIRSGAADNTPGQLTVVFSGPWEEYCE